MGKRKRGGTRGSSSFLARVGEMPVRFADAVADASADPKAEVRMPVPDHGTGDVQNLQMMIPRGREESTTGDGPERKSRIAELQKHVQFMHAFLQVINEPEKRIPVERATWPIPAGLRLVAPKPRNEWA